MSPKTTRYIKVEPTPKQLALMLTRNLEVFYGGAAGGGKSVGLLICALQYVDTPDYAALLLRRAYSDLSLPGALIDIANQWLSNTDAHYSPTTHTWTFPSGATITFGFLEGEADKYRYQSSEFQCICWDELTQFTESQYTYLFSRLRKLEKSDVPLRIRAASNPGGIGHEWVKARFISKSPDAGVAQYRESAEPVTPRSGVQISPSAPDRIFIPATLEDNPFIDKVRYDLALAQLDVITREQLRRGDWDVHAGGDIFKREWLQYYDEIPGDLERVVQGWDLAITQKSTSDYTCGVTLGVKEGIWYILDIFRARVDFPTALRSIRAKAEQFEPEAIVVESNNYQLAVVQELRRTSSLPVVSQIARSDKVQRLMGLGAFFEGGRIRLRRQNFVWAQDFISEYLEFPNGAHDDMLDALWYATERLKHHGVRSTNINVDDLGTIT